MKPAARVFPFFAVIASVVLVTPAVTEAGHTPRILNDRLPDTAAGRAISAADLAGRNRLQGDDYDVIDYELDLTLTPDSIFIHGSVKFEYVAGPAGVVLVDFNLDQPLVVDSVVAALPVAGFDHVEDVVSLELGSQVAPGDTSWFRVYYHGVPPPPGQYGTLYFRSHALSPVIYSISWPDNARSWWPCKDAIGDKATATIAVTVPEDLVVASNGVLTGTVNNGDGTKTSTWRELHPVTTYNVCVAITNYEIFLQHYEYAPGDTMLLPFYVYPEDRADAEEDWSLIPEMLALYDSLFGVYPFADEKYGMAETQTDPFAAMEHQTLTSWGNLFITGDHRYDMIVAHELAHSWYGNSVTPAEWAEIWLSEGFATYSEALWAEHTGGIGDYLAYMTILDTNDFSGSVYDPIDLLGNTVYNKGAWVVHMLRHVVGDSALFEILPAYANDPGFKYGHASTPEFISLCESITGEELDWFFDQWVYGEGEPNYLTTWEVSNPGDWEVTVTVDQVQPGQVFRMPLELLFTAGADSVYGSLYDSTGYTQQVFTLPFEPEDVVLDPHNWILNSWTKPLEITTTELSEGFTGQQYIDVLRAVGGVGTRGWSIAGGSLPDGIELDPVSGVLSGTPAVADSFSFLARVTDSGDPQHIDEKWLSILIHPGTGIEDSKPGADLPRQWSLAQNYPNPFNPQTVIGFDVPGGSADQRVGVTLEIFDLRGRSVRTLVDRDLAPGSHRVTWNGMTRDGRRADSGVYFSVLTAGTDRVLVRKMLLLE